MDNGIAASGDPRCSNAVEWSATAGLIQGSSMFHSLVSSSQIIYLQIQRNPELELDGV